MGDASTTDRKISSGWRRFSAVFGVVIAAATIAYVAVPRTVAATAPGCTLSGPACVARVSFTPQEALTIAGLLVALYCLVVAASGEIPTLKIGNNELGPARPKAAETSPAELDAAIPVEPTERAKLARVQLLPEEPEESEVARSVEFYTALPADVRAVSESLWTGSWEYTEPLSLSLTSVRRLGTGVDAPWLLETSTPGGTRVIRADVPPQSVEGLQHPRS